MRVLAFLLALLPALAVAQGAQYEPRVGGGTGNVFTPYPGRVSPIVSLVAWDKGGSDSWGAGIPSPTIDCAATGTSASASLQCSGATPSFAGPAQTAAGSPWWYRGDSAVRPSIVLNGSTDWWGLGDVADAPSRLVVCADYEMASATYRVLVGKGTFPGAAGQSWTLYMATTGMLIFYVTKTGPTSSFISSSAVSSGFATTCVSYEYATDGTSVMRGNTNGTAWTGITNAVGPIQSVAGQATIGATAVPGSYWDKSVRRVAIWTGADAPTSAAQLAQLVATQNGLAHDKPSGTVASCSRSDSTLCCPFSDAECFTLGPGYCCIHAPTYSGWASIGTSAGGIEVFGPGANALTYTETFANAAWVKSAGVSAADASASCPMSPLAGTRMSLVTTDTDADQIAQDAATTPGRSVWMARATGDAACGVTFADADGTGAQSVPLTDGPLRYWSGGTGQTGLSVARPAGGCARWCMWAAQAQAVTYPVPYRTVAAGTPYSGAASTATTLTVPVALTDPSRWAIGMTYTGPGAWGVADRFWSLGTAANSAYLAAGYLGIFDAANAQLYSSISPALASGLHSVLVDYRSPSAALRIDGADRALSFTGAGSGVLGALSPTITVGNGPALGLVSRVAQCRRAGGCR